MFNSQSGISWTVCMLDPVVLGVTVYIQIATVVQAPGCMSTETAQPESCQQPLCYRGLLPGIQGRALPLVFLSLAKKNQNHQPKKPNTTNPSKHVNSLVPLAACALGCFLDLESFFYVGLWAAFCKSLCGNECFWEEKKKPQPRGCALPSQRSFWGWVSIAAGRQFFCLACTVHLWPLMLADLASTTCLFARLLKNCKHACC